ncbi:MAG: polysaccharide deacetylase family protein [Desulfobacterales bacterium]|nr:MAG: polysaccharide deacetylase family protein [Desulfobacterales bacterium]
MSCVVYTCHNVVPLAPGEKQRGTLDINAFLYQLRWLDRMGVRFISMNHFMAWLQGKKPIPKRAAVLTFDDALVSISENVFAHLKQQAIPITIFVIAGLIGRESHFSKRPSGPKRRHLDLEQLKTLLKTGLVEVGAHGYNHRDLTRLKGDELWQELRPPKDLLEESLNVEVPYFAYPWGGTTQAAAQKVREAGYKLAFTTQKKKLVSPNIDPFRLPRVNWGRRANLFKLYKYYLMPWIRAAG